MCVCVCAFFRFYWQYKHSLLGMSEALIEWHVDQHVKPGVYRLGYFGNSRASFSK
jgi:neutral ceramidase